MKLENLAIPIIQAPMAGQGYPLCQPIDAAALIHQIAKELQV